MAYSWKMALLAAVISGVTVGPALASKSDDTLRAAFAEEILNLDYNYTTKREYIILSDLIDETLFYANPKTSEIEPEVATGYKYVNDKTIDVTLRHDVGLHDGKSLTADDVVYTYNWIIDPRSKSQAKGTIEAGWRRPKIDDYTVRFHLKTPYPLALRDMARRVRLRENNAYVVNGKIDEDAMSHHFVGAGPTGWCRSSRGNRSCSSASRAISRKPKRPIAIKNIIIRNIPDLGTQQAELMSGGIDWMFKVPLDVAKSLRRRPRRNTSRAPTCASASSCSTRTAIRIRTGPDQARCPSCHELRHQPAGDRQIPGRRLIQARLHAVRSAQFGCTQNVTKYPYNPKKAKELLAKAGYPHGFPLELWAYRDKSISEAIAADLKAVGINVHLRYVKLASLNQARAHRKIQAYFGTWGSGGTADTAAIARVHFSKPTDRNMSGDDEVSDLVLAAEQTMDRPSARSFTPRR